MPQLAQAESGQPGSNQKRHGRRGKDQVVLVPMGTVVSRLIEEITGGAQSNNTKGAKSDTGLDSDRNAGETENESDLPEWLAAWKRPWSGATDYKSDEEEDGEGSAGRQTGKKDSPVASDDSHDDADSGVFHRSGVEDGYEVLADLIQDGDEVIVARGGHGGRGNAAMRALPRRPAPKISEPAGPGEVARLLLELKLLADVALVGLPNVGKSSLLRVLSAATPRVAEYAFTTLYPQLGTVDLGPGRRVVVADVPGLIQGAHRNRGIGLRFLRHVERTSALAFVVDMAGRPPSPDAAPLPPVAQLELLREEVGQYSPDLLRRPWLVVANKIDLLPRPGTVLRALERHSAELGGCVGVVGVSATGGAGPKPKGVESLVVALTELVCPQAGDDKPYSQEA